MSMRKFCDKCGKELFIDEQYYTATVKNSDRALVTSADLCASCEYKLKKFLKKEVQSNAQNQA